MRLHILYEGIEELPDEDKFGPTCSHCGNEITDSWRVYEATSRCLECLWKHTIQHNSATTAIIWMDRAQKLHPKMLEIARRSKDPYAKKDIQNLIDWYGPEPTSEGIEELPDNDEFGDTCPVQGCGQSPHHEISFPELYKNRDDDIVCAQCGFQNISITVYDKYWGFAHAHCATCKDEYMFVCVCMNGHKSTGYVAE